MARRWTGHMHGERYLANANPKAMEVHDLDNEKLGSNECQISEIIRAGHDRPFTTLGAAHASGYDNCAYCLGNSTR